MEDTDRLLVQWRQEHERVEDLLDAVGATDDATTVVTRLQARQIPSPQHFANSLNAQIDPRETWGFCTGYIPESGRQFGLAMPLATSDASKSFLIPLVEIHSLLAGWWLSSAWRTRQLASAGLELMEASKLIGAAACVRPLVETAASAWVDWANLAKAWSNLKLSGEPGGETSMGFRTSILSVINTATWGSKFDERAPELNASWGHIPRVNVLNHVDKLSKVVGGNFQNDYQWLCNTVHPSIGNTLAFVSPLMVHETRTHAKSWMSPQLLQVTSTDSQRVAVERTVHDAIACAATVALRVLFATLDSGLRVVDDLALTSGASNLNPDAYWRKLIDVGRNERCPCRSGRKRKSCRHVWGEAGPDIPRSFGDVATL